MGRVLLQVLGRLGRQLRFVLVLPVILLAALLLGANTDLGRRLLVWGVAELSGGQVVLSGLSGTLPAAPRLVRLELRDAGGTWLAVDDAALDLALLPLLWGEVNIESLSAGSVALNRLPPRDGPAAAPIRLPAGVRVGHLAIGDLALGQAFPGAPRLAVEGSVTAARGRNVQTKVIVTAPDRTDHYRLEGGIAHGLYRLELAVQEAPGGMLAALAGPLGLRLPPDLGAWRLAARAEGPPAALALSAALEAGQLHAAAAGLLDLDSRSATGLHLSAEVPAMALESGDLPAVAWRRIALEADLSGPLDRPQGKVRVALEGLASGALGLDRLSATATGDPTRLDLTGEIQGLRTTLDLPETAATVPLRVAGELSLTDPARPFRLSLRHPLLDLAAQGVLIEKTAQATLSLPDLEILSGLAGMPLAGSARLQIGGSLEAAPRLDASGDLALTRAPGPLAGLLGPAARLAVSGQRDGDAWRLDSARIEGAHVNASAQGRAAPDSLSLGWTLELPDLGALAPGWSGRARAQGGIAGRPEMPELVAELSADAARAGAGRGRVSGRLDARLAEPGAALELKGDWAGQPLAIDLRLGRAGDGGLDLAMRESRWAGVAASGTLRLAPGAALPEGELRLSAERLANLAPLLAPGPGQELAGRLTARLTLESGAALIDAEGAGLSLPGAVRIGTLALNARVSDPLGVAETGASLRLGGLSVGQVAGDLALTALGPVATLALTAEAGLATAAGPVNLEAGGRMDARARRLALERLEARAQGETLRLLTPALLDFSDGVAVDRLRLGLGPNRGQASIDIAGRVAPQLALDARLTGLPLELVRLVAPDLQLTGRLGAEARLSGALRSPSGTVRVQAQDLRLGQGAGRSLPPAQVELSATLGAGGAQIEGHAETGGRARLGLRGRIAGTLPFAPGALDLRADGRVDLALLDPLLTAGGRQAMGQAVLDATLAGTLAAPRLGGSLRLQDGALWDRGIGLALTGIQGILRLDGDRLRVERLGAQAGSGTLALEGSVGLLAPGIPVDLRLVARNARPLQLDHLDVQGDADLTLAGHLTERLILAGTVRLSRAEIRLPERLPANIATLEVRERRGGLPVATPASRAAAWRPDLGFDLALSAPRSVYVRGRGVDAELGGEVRLGGTMADPAVSGGFNLLHGEYDLVGQRLRFTRGRLGFDGAAAIDPSLDLEARATVSGTTAILAVQGTARAPRIELRGEPEMPQDEVLSRLLFGVAGGRLSPLQAARVGLAAASLAGVDAGGFNLLERVRAGLGLGRLSVGSDERGDTILEGGRRISERVYLGARQGTRAGEPQGVLRIEVIPQVRLEADVGAAGGTRAGAAFEREY